MTVRTYRVCEKCAERALTGVVHFCDPVLVEEVALARQLMKLEQAKVVTFEDDLNFYAGMIEKAYRLICPECHVQAGQLCVGLVGEVENGHARMGPHIGRMTKAGWPQQVATKR